MDEFVDIEGFEKLRKSAIEVILGLKKGSCWCQVAIGNPNMTLGHSKACLEAKQFIVLARIGEEKKDEIF